MVDSSLVKRFGFPLGTVEYPANVFSFISEAAESHKRVFYHLNYLIINVGRMHVAFYRLYLYISSSLALQNTFLGFSNYHLLLSPSILLPHSPLKSDQMSGEESIMLGKPNSPSGSPAAAPPPLRPSWPLSAFGYGEGVIQIWRPITSKFVTFVTVQWHHCEFAVKLSLETIHEGRIAISGAQKQMYSKQRSKGGGVNSLL